MDYISKSVRLKRAGSTYKGLCPFHKEKTPSFSVSPDKQLFYCFGCGKGGTVINYVMQQENLDFVEAVKLLAEKCGMELPEDDRRTNENNLKKRQTIYKINSVSGRFFYDKLFEPCGATARDYINRRQMVQSTVNRFGLGYAPDGNLLLKHLREQGFTDDEIVDSGVVGKSENGDIYDRFRNRLMFPIIDIRKNIVGFGGRVLDDSKPKYLNSPETNAFNKSYNLFGLNLAKNSGEDYLILVEGYMDVIQLHQHGINTAIATLGTALTPEQARIIKRHKSEVIIAYDSDEAGQKATQRAIELLNEEDLRVRVLTMTGSKDPDEYIKTNGVGAFRKLIADSQEQIEYKIMKLKSKYNLDDISQKSEYVNLAAKEFISIKSPVEQELYVKKISAETGVSAESIFAEMARLRAIVDKNRDIGNFRSQSAIRTSNSGDLQQTRCKNAQKLVLNIMCFNKKQAEYIMENLSESDFDEEATRIFSAIKAIRQSGAEPDARIIVSSMPDVALAAEILHDDKNIDDPEKAARQSVEIILNYNKTKKLRNALKNDNMTSEDKL
ncbi:MAG: DNA primase, partial [bacterium]|nr:DNA primase [bacterium]